MKKFFLIAAAAVVALASCSKNESPVVENQDKAIGFNSYFGRAVSKADGSFIPKKQTWLNTNKSFGVYAYNTGKTAFTGTFPQTTTNFMVNQEVKYTGTSDATAAANYENYTYSPKKYWPNEETENLLTFWAYYPFGAFDAPTTGDDATTGDDQPAAGNDQATGPAGFAANSFVANTDPTKMVDLLLSDVKEDMTYTKAAGTGTVGIVPFTFHHALTMVKFKVKAADNYKDVTITLNNLTIKAKNNGTVTPSFTTTPEVKTSFSWEATGDVAEFVLANNVDIDKNGLWLPSKTAAATTTQEATTDVDCPAGDAFLMIPQPLYLSENQKDIVEAVIQYTVKSTDGTEVVNNKTIGLKTTEVAAWDMNKNIEYTFTIGLKPIEFTAKVTDWDDPMIVTNISVN